MYSTFYSYAPFAILLVVNLGLIAFIQQRSFSASATSETSHHNSRRSAINRTIIIVTALFFILTGPEALGVIFLKQLLSLSYGQTILFLLDNICFSYHAFSIFILYFTNSKFSNELKMVFAISRNSNVSVPRSSNLHETSVNKRSRNSQVRM